MQPPSSRDDSLSREELLQELRVLRAEISARTLSEHLEKIAPTLITKSTKKRKGESEQEDLRSSANGILQSLADADGAGSALHWTAGLSSVIVNEMYQFVGLCDIYGTLVAANRSALSGGGLKPSDVLGKPFWDAPWWNVSESTIAGVRTAVDEARSGQFVRYEVEVWGAAAGKSLITIDFSLKPVRDANDKVVFLLAEGRNITEKKQAEAELEKKNRELQQLYNKLAETDQLKSQFFANVSHELRTPYVKESDPKQEHQRKTKKQLTLILGPAERLLKNETDSSTTLSHAANSAQNSKASTGADAVLPKSNSSNAELLSPEQRRASIECIRRNSLVLLRHVNDLLDVAKLESGSMAAHFEAVQPLELLRLVAANFDVLATERNIALEVLQGGDTSEGTMVQLDREKISRVLLNLLSNAFKFTPPGGRVRATLSYSPDLSTCQYMVEDSGPGVPAELHEKIFERFTQGDASLTRRFGGTGLGLAIVKEFTTLHRGNVVVSKSESLGGAQFTVTLPVEQRTHLVELVPPTSPHASAAASITSNAGGATALTMMEQQPMSPRLSPSIRRASAPTPMQSDTAPSVSLIQSAAIQTLVDLRGQIAPSSACPARGSPSEGTVLVVEDNADMRSFIVETLSTHFLVISAVNGSDALTKLRLSTVLPDVILTDVMMPVMSGIELVSHLRGGSMPQFDNVPVVLLTAKADDRLRVQMLRGGVQDFLHKPFSADELLARLTNLARMKRARELLQLQVHSQSHDIVALSKMVVERNAEQQEMLKTVSAARLEAESLNRVKDEFLMTLSHELRTPLTGILGWVDLINDQLNAKELNVSELQQGFEVIRSCALNQARLIENLIDIAKLITGKVSLSTGGVNILSLLDAALKSLETALSSKRLRLSKRIIPPGQAIEVNGDAIRLQQVLWHLLSNAIKFTPAEGSIEVLVELRSSAGFVFGAPSNTKQLFVSVTDTGIGIDASHLERLFKHFGQLDSSSRRKFEGLGVGLAICKHLIELHGGSISVSSKGEGKGTTVSFVLQA